MLKLVLFCNMINIYSLKAMEEAARNAIRLMWITDEIKVFLDKKYLNNEYRSHNLIKIANISYLTNSGTYEFNNFTDKFNKDYYYSKKLNKRKVVYEENLFYQKEVIANLTSDLGIELRIQKSIQLEGAFSVIKENYGIKRFRRGGLKNVELEMTLTQLIIIS